MMDLTPNMKREMSGCILSFTTLNGDERTHKKVMLPLMHVCTKSGVLLAKDCLYLICDVMKMDVEQLVMANLDGGGDNNGGDRVTGKGKTGTLYNAMPNATWVWCAGHLAQLTYQDSMKFIPTFFQDGLSLIIAYVRCGDKWKQLKPFMAHFAGILIPEFEDMMLLQHMSDYCDHAGKVEANPGLQHRNSKGKLLCEYDETIIKSASKSRFAGLGPGNAQIIAVAHLLRPAIIALEGGGDVTKVKKPRALRALGTLECTEWHYWSAIFNTSFNEVVQPMFKAIMSNDSYNMPALSRGEWRKWSASSMAVLNLDGSLDLSKCGGAKVRSIYVSHI